MITIGTKVVLLNDGDEIFTHQGRMVLSNIQIIASERIITYTAENKECGTALNMWADIESVFHKVIEG